MKEANKFAFQHWVFCIMIICSLNLENLLKEQKLKRLERIPEKKILKEEKPRLIEFLIKCKSSRCRAE
jgi:hypothetical protein